MPELLEAGVHFGHQTKRWNPKMKPYIFEKRNQIYIINLDETVKQLQRATEFLQEVTRRGGKILFVGCKKQAQEAVKEAATGLRTILRQPTLAGRNVDESGHHSQEHRPIEIHRADREVAGIQEDGQTGTRGALNREAAKLRRNLEGILEMAQLPDAMVIIDTPREAERRSAKRGGSESRPWRSSIPMPIRR